MAPLTEQELEGEYRKWVNSLPKDQRRAVKAKGLDKPAPAFPSSPKQGGGYEGLQVSRQSQTSEPDAAKLCIVARDLYELAHIGASPLEEIMEEEEATISKDSAEFSQAEAARIKADAISALMAYCFSPVNGTLPSPVDVASKIYILCYSIRPELVEGYSLERIARCWDTSRQCFSKRLIKMDNALNLHARNRKGVAAVSLYREGTRAWHQERKAAEKAAKRKEYLSAWKKAHAAEQKAYQAQYRAKHRDRLNAAKRKHRAKVPSP